MIEFLQEIFPAACFGAAVFVWIWSEGRYAERKMRREQQRVLDEFDKRLRDG